jgi:hypothetical protein
MNRKKLWADYLPKYFKIGKYTLALWTWDGTWKSTRITIREDHLWMFTIKQGEYQDRIRCSKDFKPFGINLQKFFKNTCQQ